MQDFIVHSYLIVRIKVEGVKAENAEGAIKAVEENSDLQQRMAKAVRRETPGAEISAIELDEGAAAVSYLVDVAGDEEFEQSRNFDVNSKGELVEIGKEPGAGIPVNVIQRAALANYADGDLRSIVSDAVDQRNLVQTLSNEYDDILPVFIAKELASLNADETEEAVNRLEAAIEDLTHARDAIESLPASLDKLNASAIQAGVDQDTIPVIVGGTEVGTIQRSRSYSGKRHGLWRNAAFVINNTPVAWGMDKIMAYVRDSFGRAPEVVIQIHPGYHAIFGPDGIPAARVITNADRHHLRVFEPHRSEVFATLEEALLAGGLSGSPASAYAKVQSKGAWDKAWQRYDDEQA